MEFLKFSETKPTPKDIGRKFLVFDGKEYHKAIWFNMYQKEIDVYSKYLDKEGFGFYNEFRGEGPLKAESFCPLQS